MSAVAWVVSAEPVCGTLVQANDGEFEDSWRLADPGADFQHREDLAERARGADAARRSAIVTDS